MSPCHIPSGMIVCIARGSWSLGSCCWLPIGVSSVHLVTWSSKSQIVLLVTGALLLHCCFGCASDLLLFWMQCLHQLLKGRCVKLRSARSCGVGWPSLLNPLAGAACYCSSSPAVNCSSLYDDCSSKFVEPVHVMFNVAFVFVIHVEPVHVMFNVAFVFVIQSSSSLHGLLPFVGLTNVILSGRSCVTSGPSCVCWGM